MPTENKKQVYRPMTAMTWLKMAAVAVSYFLVECYAYVMLQPGDLMGLAFGGAWALLLSAVVLCLPKMAGRVTYGVSYYLIAGWTIGQTGYYQTFGKIMWLTDLFYLDEGAVFLGDVLSGFSATWWIGAVVLLAIGGVLIAFWPDWHKRVLTRTVGVVTAAAAVVALFLLPQALFVRDNEIWGTHSEYGQSSSYRAKYTTMYNAQSVYEITGMYHLTARDFWKHQVYPNMPSYQIEMQSKMRKIDAFFNTRGDQRYNKMTGIFEGKNVVLVLMESMDDWMITEEDTPTISRLMDEGINFTNFYTPFYGSARTLNSEFCVNSGIFLPTNGHYVFDYVTNHFNQSMAAQFVDNGYTAEVFHYNEPDFYSRGVFEPAMGYNKYNTYEDYTEDEEDLYDECYLFNNAALNDLFFREGQQTFNFIITRSAHLSYVYNEVLSYRALKQYPEYRGKYGHEEVDCALVKAKLVDDMFARLLQELEAHGQLENTVIVGVTDHYTYGFDDVQKLMELSGVDEEFKLEKTPCFIWSADGPAMEVTKTLNTSDLLPTVLNLMGIQSPYNYLGRDAFDSQYIGYALFSDGSWIVNGTLWRPEYGDEMKLLTDDAKLLTEQERELIDSFRETYGQISNLLLTTDYYKKIR